MRRLFWPPLQKVITEHVAQSVEHLTFNEVVVGSIPTVLTTHQVWCDQMSLRFQVKFPRSFFERRHHFFCRFFKDWTDHFSKKK